MLTRISLPASALLPLSTVAAWGKIYRSEMPFRYDNGTVLDEAVSAGVTTIVMLVSDAEALEKCGHDLREVYSQRHLHVVYFPIHDFDTPSDSTSFTNAVREAAQVVVAGKSILVHCSAGIGRTGMFLACLVRELTRCEADQAISHVREFIPTAVETEEQEQVVLNYVPSAKPKH
jgi:protein-tyrosine phosphatase